MFSFPFFPPGDFLLTRRPDRLSAGIGTASEFSPSITQHKSNKTRLCKYFSGFSTSSRVLLLTVCWSSEWAIVWPRADCFVLCCWTWLVCCRDAAVPACMQEQRTGLRFSLFNWLPGVHCRLGTAHTTYIIWFSLLWTENLVQINTHCVW